MIRIEHLTFGYSGKPFLFERFDWGVGRGESWTMIGPSGCGKSTLLYLLAGLLAPNDGMISIDGQPLYRPRPHTGLILQDYGLLPWATLRQNARLGLEIRQFYGPDGKHAPQQELEEGWASRVEEWLERLDISDVADQYPSRVSGGQRQRAAIARTLALDPDLLLMDEPFASLDAPTREALQRLIWQFHLEKHLTTVLVTHSIEEALFLGERVLILNTGVNRQAKILLNPYAGKSVQIRDAGYQALFTQVRQALEKQSA